MLADYSLYTIIPWKRSCFFNSDVDQIKERNSEREKKRAQSFPVRLAYQNYGTIESVSKRGPKRKKRESEERRGRGRMALFFEADGTGVVIV